MIKAKDISWNAKDEDDFFAEFSHKGIDFIVRIELMDTDMWWCSISTDKNNIWDNQGSFKPTFDKAFAQLLDKLNEIVK